MRCEAERCANVAARISHDSQRSVPHPFGCLRLFGFGLIETNSLK